ncbi:MAG: diphthamide synthesis protein [Candidatus Woesearchaeota archaeon]|nr:diphthamide synthesis protein [Candidatus Woesearchaeota archaeon]
MNIIENENYDLQLDDAVKQIKDQEAKRVLLQLPDGVKPYADQIQAGIKKECPDVELLLWADSCFGACDAPIHVKHLGVDLLLAFGHAPWRS